MEHGNRLLFNWIRLTTTSRYLIANRLLLLRSPCIWRPVCNNSRHSPCQGDRAGFPGTRAELVISEFPSSSLYCIEKERAS